MGDKAWTAQELAEKLGMHVLTLRRYLRISANVGVLTVKRHGRYKYYCVKKTYEKWKKEVQK